MADPVTLYYLCVVSGCAGLLRGLRRSHLGRPRRLLRCEAKVRNRERRENGKEQMVQVHYDEGVAIHIGPESCAGGREAVREALTGECAGQPPAFAGAGY